MIEPSDYDELRSWYDDVVATGSARATLLRWYRTVGYARCDGVGVDMREPPAIVGQDIEYLPGVAMRIDGRDMTLDEQRVVRGLLAQMSTGAKDALAGCSKLVVSIEGAK